MTAVYIAWLLLSFVVILWAARTAVADLRERQREGRSWEPEHRVSGRF